MTLKNILNQPEGGFSPVIDAYKALKFLSFVGFWIFFCFCHLIYLLRHLSLNGLIGTEPTKMIGFLLYGGVLLWFGLCMAL